MHWRVRVIARAVAHDIELLIVADLALVTVEYLQRSDYRARVGWNLQTAMTCLADNGVHAVGDVARCGIRST